MMNPLKWAVWIRIAIVASILWEGWGFLLYRGRFRGYTTITNDLLVWSIPVVLFWGIAWIAHGIRQKKATKEGKAE